MNSLELYFTDGHWPQLERTVFCHDILPKPISAVRGATGGAFGEARTFRWSAALQALVVLLLRSAATGKSPSVSGIGPAVVKGGDRSLAASLDYALSKQPNWVLDVFGVLTDGTAVARRMFRRTNPERKRGGDVAISVNSHFFPPSSIRVIVGSQEVEEIDQIMWLAGNIEASWLPGRGGGEDAGGGHARESSRVGVVTSAPLVEPFSSISVCRVSEKLTTEQAYAEYRAGWEQSATFAEAIARLQNLSGRIEGRYLALLESQVKILIFNTKGDCRVTFSFRALNLADEPIERYEHDLWFERPVKTLKATGFSDLGGSLGIQVSKDSPNYKRLTCYFGGKVAPMESVSYGFSYRTEGTFPEHWWHTKVHSLMNRTCLSITDYRGGHCKSCHVAREMADGSSKSEPVDLFVRESSDHVTIEWQKSFPAPGDLYRTHWEFA